MTRPERCRRITGRTARVTVIGPKRLVSIWERTCSVVISSKKPARKLPALLSSTSMPPKRSVAAAAASSALWGSVTSRAVTSRFSCAPTAERTVSGLRPVATTLWPAARAARANSTPMPRPAPVISQVFVMASTLGPLWRGRGCCKPPSATPSNYAWARGPPRGDPGVPDVAPGAGDARAGRAVRARRRCSTGAGAASRGGRGSRRRQRGLLHPARARRRRRRLRQRAERRRARTVSRRCRTSAPVPPRPPARGDTPGSVPRRDPAERAADPRRLHRRPRARAQPAMGLPRGQPAGPRGVLGDLRRSDRTAQPRSIRVPRRPRPRVLRRLADRGPRHGTHPALRSRTSPPRPPTRGAHRGAVAHQCRVPDHLVTARRATPRSRPAPLPPPARGRAQPRLRGRGTAGRPRPDASAGHRRCGVTNRNGAAPARGDDRARRLTALPVPAVPCRPPDRAQLPRHIAPSPVSPREGKRGALGQTARLLL